MPVNRPVFADSRKPVGGAFVNPAHHHHHHQQQHQQQKLVHQYGSGRKFVPLSKLRLHILLKQQQLQQRRDFFPVRS
jgi:hypothetical protein